VSERVDVPLERERWRIDDGVPKKLEPTRLPTESGLVTREGVRSPLGASGRENALEANTEARVESAR